MILHLLSWQRLEFQILIEQWGLGDSRTINTDGCLTSQRLGTVFLKTSNKNNDSKIRTYLKAHRWDMVNHFSMAQNFGPDIHMYSSHDLFSVVSMSLTFSLNKILVLTAHNKTYFIGKSRAALSLRIISINTQILALKLWSYIRVCTSYSNTTRISYLPPRTLQAMTFHSRSFPSIDWLDGVLRNRLSDDDTLVMVLWWGDWTEEPLDDPDIWRTKYFSVKLSNINWNTISLFEDWKPCLIHYVKNTIGTYINLNG